VPYSPHPITIDGVSLDSFAWNIEAKVRPWPSVRSGDNVVPGVDGEVPSLNDDAEAGLLTLNMWVRGTDPTGAVPSGSSGMSLVRSNLDALAFMFGRRYALLNIQEIVDQVGTIRQCWGKVIDQVLPEIRPGGWGRFAVNVKIPDVFWQDVNTSDWSQTAAASGTSYEVTTLQGATAPVADATFLVTGPATNPQINDATTSAYVRLNRALAAGELWRVNSATWATRYGAGLTLGSADSAGTDAQALTLFGGGTARFLRLQPVQTPITVVAETILRTNHEPNPEPASTTGWTNDNPGAAALVTAPWDSTRTALQVPAAISQANLLTNTGFETDLTGWTEVDASAILTLTRDTATVHSGVGSLKMAYSGGGAGQLGAAQVTVSGLVAGFTYTVTAWLYCPTGSTGVVPVIIVGAATSSTAAFTANTWTQRSLTFTATGTTQVVTIQNFNATAAGNIVYVDDVTVVAVAQLTYAFTATAAAGFTIGDVVTVRAKVKTSNPDRGTYISIHQRSPNTYHVAGLSFAFPAQMPSGSNATSWYELVLTAALPATVPAGQLDVAILTQTVNGTYAYVESGETLTVGDVYIGRGDAGPYFDGSQPPDTGGLWTRWTGTVDNSRSEMFIPATIGPGVRRVNVSLTGTGFTAATSLAVRARRKFLQ
jgi:hypothetical protein